MRFHNISSFLVFLGFGGGYSSHNPIAVKAQGQGQGRLVVLPAQVDRPHVWANVGERAEIFCSVPPSSASPSPSGGNCQFLQIQAEESQSENSVLISINATDNVITGISGDGAGSMEGYQVYGNNLGECGLRIFHVGQDHFGKWVCAFVSVGNNVNCSGIVEIHKYERTEPPYIFLAYEDHNEASLLPGPVNVTDYETGGYEMVHLICCANEGKPLDATELTIHLDDEVVKNVTVFVQATPSTCVEWTTFFTKEDHNKSVICIVDHPAFRPYVENIEELEAMTVTSLGVNVNYAPEILYLDNQTQEWIYRIDYLSYDEVQLHFSARGNPTPLLEVKALNYSSGSGIGDHDHNEDIEVKGVEIHSEKNRHDYILTLTPPLDEEGNLTLELTLFNDLGKVCLQTIVTPPPGSGPWTPIIMITIGVGMTLLFLCIIGSGFFLNFEAQRKGCLCYKGRAETYSIKSPAEYAVVPQKENPKNKTSTTTKTDDIEMEGFQ